ncbi:MAG: CDP-alcohol phosphatidyltransferase family protein [Candidatus Eisenbacteria bacterium]|uniref:CDP-alcohol phosphatidyltransferase family protein n=1 Tax=Eiseniibacteriota bacterium TaxID=2212470 RepID=A0A956NBE9_UNCEI|nr:CDP-alcohol phosphatidyltransferase family protein [Candidatus Eisenbacteria bacterium]MCB9465775.1 CDP-alcohol phosphatidyltransferase family protein [Candidatus Eisenbacteria bacterium]
MAETPTTRKAPPAASPRKATTEKATTEKAERKNKALLAEPEKRVLRWVAARLPQSITPDHLTLLALFGAALTAAGYTLANHAEGYLWLASAGLVVHWFGDSLDGTLARVRKIERPKYGFYVDHLADGVATAMIGLGLGFSPYMLLAVGLAIVVGYLILSINIYLETITQATFRFDYGVVGPTEARILLILLNTAALLIGPNEFSVPSITGRPLVMTPFDIVGIAGSLGMVALLGRRLRRNLRVLGELEPAGGRKND